MLVKPWQHIKIYLQLASSTGKLINLHNNKECIKKQNKIANKYYTFLAQTCQYKVVMQILMSRVFRSVKIISTMWIWRLDTHIPDSSTPKYWTPIFKIPTNVGLLLVRCSDTWVALSQAIQIPDRGPWSNYSNNPNTGHLYTEIFWILDFLVSGFWMAIK